MRFLEQVRGRLEEKDRMNLGRDGENQRGKLNHGQIRVFVRTKCEASSIREKEEYKGTIEDWQT